MPGKAGDKYPDHIRQKAIQRVAMGEYATHVAESMDIHKSTVIRWCKDLGIERGSAMNPEAGHLYDTPDEVLDTFKKELKRQNIDEALGMFLKMQDGVEDKYRVLMAQQLYQLFHSVMANPPRIKNWSDAEKAHKIMKEVLKWNNVKGGGKTKIDIQFEVVQAKPKGAVIDADEVEDDEEDDDRGD